MKIQGVKGASDILPEEIGTWQALEEKTAQVFERFGFSEIRNPIFEHTELFVRSVGEGTDIVSKEMYTFPDKGEKFLTLRPEATASVVRAYLQHSYHVKDPFQKWYYIGPMFRRERPQAGRARQFHQIGVEVLGGSEPGLDGEIIALLFEFFKAIGLEKMRLIINSVGCLECRKDYINNLRNYFAPLKKDLCPDCHVRLEKNVMRVLDCKVKECQPLIEKAPQILDSICEPCRTHFDKVKEILDWLGLPYEINPRLVRGLDYYTRTVFEITHPGLGAQDAIGAGGRYDNLIGQLGGPKEFGATGFALGIERILLALKSEKKEIHKECKPLVYLVSLGEEAWKSNYKKLFELRSLGLYAEMEMGNKSLKSQMRSADKSGAQFALVLGENELNEKVASVKHLRTGEEAKVTFDQIVHFFKEKEKEVAG